MKKYNVINGTLEKRFKPRKFTRGAQVINPRPVPTDANPLGAMANVGAATAAGFATGGPVGGAVGLVTSSVGEFLKHKQNQEADAAALQAWKGGEIERMNNNTLDFNQIVQQHGQMAKLGKYATGTEAIEVEKDELIFTKTPTGKYVLKADYQGGKTHNQGGEDYQAADGDIIFPGKDRKKVMKAYKSQDYPKLESMRMSLPKDTKVAGDGRDGTTDPKEQYAAILEQVKAGNLPQSYADEFYAKNANALQDAGNYDLSGLPQPDLGYNVPRHTSERVWDEQTKSYKKKIGLTPEEMAEDMSSMHTNIDKDISWLTSPDQRLRPKSQAEIDASLATTPEAEVTTPGGGKKTPPLFDPGAPKGITDIPALSTFEPEGMTVDRANQMGRSVTQLQNVPEGGGGFNLGKAQGIAGYASQGLAALSNLFPGKAEVQTSPKVQLDRLKYRDTSERLRQASKMNERVQAANARNVAGGNIQNYRANRELAGLQHMRNLQGINADEFQRAFRIANENQRISGREAMYNNQLAVRDQDVNAANRGARRNMISAGIQQLGELGATASRDRLASSNQEQLRKAISSGMYRIGADGTIELNS